MAPKIQDIVVKTGVSVSTVSRILNGEKKYKFAKDTVDKVKKAAEELGYRPNYFARSLKQGRTKCIGLMGNMGIANFNSPYISGVANGIEKAMMAEQSPYSLFIFGGNNPKGSDETIDLIRKGLVDGLLFIIVAESLPAFEKEFLPLLRENDVPFVVIHSLSQELPYNNVGVNIEQAGYLAARVLLEKGHKQVAFYNHQPHSLLIQGMEAGVIKAFTEKGVTWDQDTVLIPKMEGQFYERAFNAFSKVDPFPKAVITPTDRTCMGLVRAAEKRGLKVPEDVDVIRISDAPIFREALGDIPQIHHPVEEKAAAALRMLIEVLEGKREKGKIHQEVMQPKLIDE